MGASASVLETEKAAHPDPSDLSDLEGKEAPALVEEIGRLRGLIAAAEVPTPAGSEMPAAAEAEGPFTLVLVRHGESEWNNTNQFTGWYDCGLTEKGVGEAIAAGKLLKEGGYKFDVAYTSYLKRAISTCWHSLEQSEQQYVPVKQAWELNERHYGGLTGLNKQETVDKHGKEQVLVWRRSYDVPPPPLEEGSEYYSYFMDDPRYAHIPKDKLPLTESLELTVARVMPYFNNEIAPLIKSGKKVIIAAHGNSLRALIMALDGISKEDIAGLNVPTAVPLVYELDKDLKPIPHADAIAPLQGHYLGDQDAIKEKILGVKNQTK